MLDSKLMIKLDLLRCADNAITAEMLNYGWAYIPLTILQKAGLKGLPHTPVT